MNVFFKELTSYRKALFFWSLGMIFLIGSGMAKFAALETSGQSINTILNQFPKDFQIIFGLSGFDLSKTSGYFGVLFLYIGLMATVHAVLIGSDIIAKEERDKTSEFLFVKPMSRARIMSAKLAAGLVNLVIFNLVTLFSSVYFVSYFNKHGPAPIHDVLVLMAGLFMLQLLFFCLGAAVAAVSSKPKTSASVATAILLVTFILSFMVDINGSLANLKYLTPFKYFDAHTIIATGKLDLTYVIISLVVIMCLLGATYTVYSKRDLSV